MSKKRRRKALAKLGIPDSLSKPVEVTGEAAITFVNMKLFAALTGIAFVQRTEPQPDGTFAHIWQAREDR